METNPQINADNIGQTEKISAPKKEPTVFQKVGSRLMREGRIAVLGLVLAAACNNAEKTAVKTPAVPIPNAPVAQESIEAMPSQETVITDPQIASEKISRMIESSNAPQDQKDQLKEQFAQQEQARQSLSLLEAEYEAEKTNGIPTLLAQTENMFDNMYLKPIWENDYPSEEAYLESLIFFLHDKRKIDNTFLTAANLPDAKFVDIQSLIQHLPLTLQAQVETYAKMNTQKEPTITFGEIQSNNPDDVANNQQEQARLREQIDKLPLISNIKITFGNISSGDFNISTGEAILGANNNPVDLINHVVIGHGQDIYDNYAMLESLSPKDIIRLMIARNNAVLDPKVGIQYLDPEKIYSPNRKESFIKLNAHEPLNLEEFGAQISEYPTNYFLGFANREGNSDFNPFNRILKSQTLEKLAREEITMTTPIVDKTFSGFLEKVTEDVANIDAENKLTGILFQRIIEKQELYKLRFGEDTTNSNPNFGFTKGETFKTLKRELLPEELTRAIFENDREVLSAIPPNQLKQLLKDIVDLAMATNREQQAVGIEWTLNTPGLTLTETGNPYQTYLDLLWEIKNSGN